MSSPTWIEIPSHGVFVYSERATASVPELCRAWIAALIEQLGVGPKALQISTKNSMLRWRKYSAKVVDEALADEQALSIVLAIGAPSPVRLGARIQLRRDPMLRPSPWVTWLACDAERWPADVFVPVARRWLTLAAELGAPLSGGVLAATTLARAKNEASLEREIDGDRFASAADVLFDRRLDLDNPNRVDEHFRRLYPITLLGPRYASAHNAALLQAAGARVESVGTSLLVDAYPQVVPAWSLEYLAATVALRRLAWPRSLQNPADAAGLGLKARFEISDRVPPPPKTASDDEARKALKAEMKELDALIKLRGPAPEISGALDVQI